MTDEQSMFAKTMPLAEYEAMREQLAAAEKRADAAETALKELDATYKDMCETLQAACREFDDGKNIGRRLDRAVVDLLRSDRKKLAEIATACAKIEAIAKGETP